MAFKLDMVRLTGLVAAPFTPMHADGSLNLDMIPVLAASMVKNGVTGAFVCGTTGEGMSLTTAERMAVAERWMQVSGQELKIIVHVGHTCLADARKLAAHAQTIGAHAIGAMAPCFFKPAGPQELADFCAAIAAAAPATPFYYYHIPSMTGVDIHVPAFLEAAAHIPNLAGVKYTHWDLMDFSRAIRMAGGRFDILFGRDEYLLSGLGLGARGAIGSTYCFAAPVYQRLWKAFNSGDIETARKEQALAADMIAAFIPYGGLPAQKAIMQMVGLDCGPVRLPLRPLTEAQYKQLRADLDRVGFFDLCANQVTDVKVSA